MTSEEGEFGGPRLTENPHTFNRVDDSGAADAVLVHSAFGGHRNQVTGLKLVDVTEWSDTARAMATKDHVATRAWQPSSWPVTHAPIKYPQLNTLINGLLYADLWDRDRSDTSQRSSTTRFRGHNCGGGRCGGGSS